MVQEGKTKHEQILDATNQNVMESNSKAAKVKGKVVTTTAPMVRMGAREAKIEITTRPAT